MNMSKYLGGCNRLSLKRQSPILSPKPATQWQGSKHSLKKSQKLLYVLVLNVSHSYLGWIMFIYMYMHVLQTLVDCTKWCWEAHNLVWNLVLNMYFNIFIQIDRWFIPRIQYTSVFYENNRSLVHDSNYILTVLIDTYIVCRYIKFELTCKSKHCL